MARRTCEAAVYYDAKGRISRTVNSNGTWSSYEYGSSGNVIKYESSLSAPQVFPDE